MRNRQLSGRLSAVVMCAAFFLPSIVGSALGQNVTEVTVPAEVVSYPEMVVFNGKIMTMDDKSTNPSPGTIAEAMAVRDGKVMRSGRSADILRLAGPTTQRIDLKGRTLIPGIVDAHTHMHDRGLNRWIEQNPEAAADAVGVFRVRGSNSDELRKNLEVLLKERVVNVEKGKWVFVNLPVDPGGSGKGVGVEFLLKRAITMKELDKLVPDKPMILVAHPAYIVNSEVKRALKEMYGFEPTPQEVEETGFAPGGVEYRRMAVVDGYFKDKVDKLAEIIRDELLRQAAAGVTTFSSHIMGIKNFHAYMRLSRENRLPIRFAYTTWAGFQVNPDPSAFYLRMGDMAGFGNDYLWSTGVGASSLDSGPPLICTSIAVPMEMKSWEYCKNEPGKEFAKALYTAIVSGSRVAVGHNYGDRSADLFMDMLEEAIKKEPGITLDHIRSLRLTMDHCGLYPRPDQIPRMKKLGIMLSCGGNSMTRMYPWLEVYGKDKAKWISPVKSILEGGVKVVFETEVPIELGLFSQMIPLMTRKNQQGIVVAPEEAVDRVTLMKMATSWPAEFVLREDVIGSLEPGKWADFLVLNKDYFTVPVEEIATTYPLMTVVGGQTVFLGENLARELGTEAVGVQLKYVFEGPPGTRPREGQSVE